MQLFVNIYYFFLFKDEQVTLFPHTIGQSFQLVEDPPKRIQQLLRHADGPGTATT